jgi:hypothetical protein
MLSDIVNIIVDWISVIESLKSCVRHVFFILCPGNPCRFKEIDNGGDLDRDIVKIIVSDTEVVSANDRYVIWLRWMSYGEVVGEKDALGCEEL